jgi:hypothetical protein
MILVRWGAKPSDRRNLMAWRRLRSCGQGFCETPYVLIQLNRWVRLRQRAAMWRQWKTPRRRRAALLELGGSPATGQQHGWQCLGPWYLARAKALSVGLSNAYFTSLELPTLIGSRGSMASVTAAPEVRFR